MANDYLQLCNKYIPEVLLLVAVPHELESFVNAVYIIQCALFQI